MRRALLAGLYGLLFGLSAGCASLPTGPIAPSCEPRAERGDARAVSAFPGVATQRIWARLAPQGQDWTRAQWRDFLARLRDVALHAGQPGFGLARGDDCVEHHLQDLWPEGQPSARSERIEQWQHALQIPSEYSSSQRALGAYPLAAPFLAAGIRGYQAEFQRQWGALSQQGWREYHIGAEPFAASEVAAALREAPRDHLGAPLLPADLSQALATAFAPSWVVPAQMDYDRPGRPQADPLGVDVQQPEVYWRLDYTLLHGRILPQVSWVVWFSQRPPESAWDPYAGALDGVVWRTTFGLDGWPLVHDSIHACGCYHLVFPVRHSPRTPDLGAWQEARLQPAPRIDSALLRVVLRSGDHMVMDVQSRQQPSAASSHAASLHAWSEARQILSPRMNPQGVIDGSERPERWWLWPSGVRSAGAMRDWGRHATAFLGSQHFDDARVLEPYVEPTAVWP